MKEFGWIVRRDGGPTESATIFFMLQAAIQVAKSMAREENVPFYVCKVIDTHYIRPPVEPVVEEVPLAA